MLSHVLLLAALTVNVPQQDAFRQNVRSSEPLSAQKQQAAFHLPPGFEIELVASEPQIYKPMNLAFDARGRLWVSSSIEYPYAAEAGKGRDQIQVMEDTNGDGRFDKTTTFVDGLNIPIGLLPYRDGVIAYSIPNIYFFRDTDGDGRCDRREVLYGPLGQPRDTHGMQNAFRRGFDGWIYINHGFSNTSTITGKDGSSITMQSGNTYRIRPDGSRVEQYTWGQVNPFGSTFTPWGDLLTADCHSKPLTLLIRGGHYSSFGKPHDGIGFVPPMMDHLHGSTGIAGVVHYTGEHFPARYRGKLFVGNVVTSRVNSDVLKWEGSTAKAVEQADFIRSEDPWFRPVDLREGPDGALYVADFYNRIIGHYEVPLDHPGRDRHRGRIWRVTYGKSSVKPRAPNLAEADAPRLIESLKDSNLQVAKLALDQLCDRVGAAAVNGLRRAAKQSTHAQQHALLLWALLRLEQLTSDDLASAFDNSDSPLLRGHIMKAAAEAGQTSTQSNSNDFVAIAAAGLHDSSPVVRRFAADALGRHRAVEQIDEMLASLEKAANDPYLQRSLQIALRDVLKSKGSYQQPAVLSAKPSRETMLAHISLAVPTADAANFLLRLAKQGRLPENQRVACLGHIATHLPANRVAELVSLIRDNSTPVALQESLLATLEMKLSARGLQPSAAVREWAAELVAKWLGARQDNRGWRVTNGAECWDIELRDCEDGRRGVAFVSSLPGGERAVSVLRSKTFKMPASLSFYLCGHRGFPDKPAGRATFVVLRQADGKELARAHPPRNDRAKQIAWSFPDQVGKPVYVEVVDQNRGSAYAWLAVSRFEPPVLAIPESGRRDRERRIGAAARAAAAFELNELLSPLREIASAEDAARSARTAAAKAIAKLESDSVGAALAEISALPATASSVNLRVTSAIAAAKREQYEKLLTEWMKSANRPAQRNAAIQLSTSSEGAKILLPMIEKGLASAQLLQEIAVQQRLVALDSKNRKIIERLTANLPPPSAEAQARIKTTVDGFRAIQTTAIPDSGRQIFVKNCQACHQVGGKGELIGPQLDGIGNRGLARIAEDLLDPNRNVDAQFRASTIALTDGRVLAGLFRRKEGKLLAFADEKGKEFTVNVDDIEDRRQSLNSLMPTNVTEELKPTELRDLLAYLLSLRK